MATRICLYDAKMAFNVHRSSLNLQPSVESSINLDATNVLAVLQRAEREKSEAVVNDCVRFLRVNVQQMVTAAELADVSEEVIKRLANGSCHGDVEALKDKADRIKSRLFRHLTKRLLEPDAKPELGSPESAANVFRCSACSKLLHQRTASKVRCNPGNVNVDKYGEHLWKHTRNEQWNAKLYVKALFFRRKSWRHVYWKLWSDIHFLECVKCATTFPCGQMSFCAYHPLAAKFAAEPGGRNATAPIGLFPCCRRPACRFDPWEMNDKGCRYRDHVVNPSSPMSLSVHREFVCHRDIIYASNNETSACWDKSKFSAAYFEAMCPESEPAVDVGTPTTATQDGPIKSEVPSGRESRRRPRSDTCGGGGEPSDGRICCGDGGGSPTSSSSSSSSTGSLDNRRTREDISTSSSSSCDDDDEGSSNSVSLESSGAYECRKSTPAVLWDVSRSRRYNHDVLRDYEQRRFREMIDELTVCKDHHYLPATDSGPSTVHVRPARLQHQQKGEQWGHPAGIYGRLEGEWRTKRATNAAIAAAAAATEAAGTLRPRMTSVMAIAKFKVKKNC